MRRENTIDGLIRGRADITPEAIAIASPGRAPITYKQLLAQVNVIIAALEEFGIGQNDRLAIVLPGGAQAAMIFLGVSCAAISAPLNPSCQDNEFEWYLTDLPAKAIVVQSHQNSAALQAAQRLGVQVIELALSADPASDLFTLKTSMPGSPVRRRPVASDDAALILHTSGTTSKPKKVPLTHGNLCASAFSVRDALGLTDSDRCLGVMPLFHIHGLVGGLLASLAAGGTFSPAPSFDGERFFQWMEEIKPTWYTAVPAIHQEILSRARGRAAIEATGRLRFIRSSSAPMPRRLMAQMEEAFKVPVIEAYGMTEASHQITSNHLASSGRKPGSVGTAADTEIAIMDETGNFVAQGNPGEVVLRGVNVTAGYEAGELNRRAFVHGWFRTGDLGYLDADGFLFLTGRLKEIINRGGEKISPREIDEALLGHPDVLQAVAFATPHASLGEDLAAAVVVGDPTRTTETGIRDYLAGQLPVFKIPSQVLIVDDIPKGSTGKVRRNELAEEFAKRLQGSFLAPRNHLEARVARIYAEVLEIERVGAEDNFFALGGDSLRAMQVLSRIRSLFSVNLSIATLFFNATVAQFAEQVSASIEALDQNSKTAMLVELDEVYDERPVTKSQLN